MFDERANFLVTEFIAEGFDVVAGASSEACYALIPGKIGQICQRIPVIIAIIANIRTV